MEFQLGEVFIFSTYVSSTYGLRKRILAKAHFIGPANSALSMSYLAVVEGSLMGPDDKYQTKILKSSRTSQR